MRCKRKEMNADVEEYQLNKGLEDGFTPYKDIIIAGFVYVDNLVKVTQENGTVVCPYVRNRRGCTFICNGDYVITDADGTRHVCGSDKIWNRYEKLEA